MPFKLSQGGTEYYSETLRLPIFKKSEWLALRDECYAAHGNSTFNITNNLGVQTDDYNFVMNKLLFGYTKLIYFNMFDPSQPSVYNTKLAFLESLFPIADYENNFYVGFKTAPTYTDSTYYRKVTFTLANNDTVYGDLITNSARPDLTGNGYATLSQLSKNTGDTGTQFGSLPNIRFPNNTRESGFSITIPVIITDESDVVIGVTYSQFVNDNSNTKAVYCYVDGLFGTRTAINNMDNASTPSVLRIANLAPATYQNWIKANYKSFDPSLTDPYADGGTSTTGGGTGNFDLSSDAIAIPNLPTLSAVDTGLVSLYTPTLAQMQSLASYLWNADATTVDWWKKLIANPLDLILGLSIVPVAVPTSGAVSVKVGLIDTGVTMNKASSQYAVVDCGSINVVEFYGAALDYLPFRKTSIYLPFIGTRTISTDDIMGKTVHVVYNIDLLSGALTAMIKCGDAVLYQFSGSCAMSIPLTGQTFTDMITSTIQLAAGVAATVASGGAAAGIVGASAANSVMSMKPTIERAGGVSGAAGQLAVMRPYLIGEIPRQSVPENYNTFAGYPSNIKAELSTLQGYTEIETVYLQNIEATDTELNEIETLLKAGVFL